MFVGFSCFLFVCFFHQPSTFQPAIRLFFLLRGKEKKPSDCRVRLFTLHVQESKGESTYQSERGNISINLSIRLQLKNVSTTKNIVKKHRLRCLKGRMTISYPEVVESSKAASKARTKPRTRSHSNSV